MESEEVDSRSEPISMRVELRRRLDLIVLAVRNDGMVLVHISYQIPGAIQ